MINSIYSLYDRKAQYYLPLFTAQTDTDAIRMFSESIITSDLPLSKYPADFDLIRIGTVDLEKGILTPEHPTYPVINGLVALQNANVERARYQAVLNPGSASIGSEGWPVGSSSPEAS